MLVVDLPILKIIPIEAHRLKLQVGVTVGSVQTILPFKTQMLNLSWVGEALRQGKSMEPLPGKTPTCTGMQAETPWAAQLHAPSCGPG